jgi:hypothetical protein
LRKPLGQDRVLDSSNMVTTLLAAKAKIAQNKKHKTIGKSFDSIQALVSLEESVTHHLDEISLCTAEQQETSRKVLSNEFLNVLTHYIDELNSTRDCDVKLNFSNETQSSRLQSSSIAVIGSIQHTKVNILLKVLFDSGSDKTIFKRSSMPQGIEPSTGKKRKVTGVNASSVINQYVMLTDILSQSFRHHNAFQVQFVH